MSDDQSWQAPDAPRAGSTPDAGSSGSHDLSGGSAVPPPPAPPVAPPAQPFGAGPYGVPQSGQPAGPQHPGQPYGVQPGWTPPPKPGLVPLRPMTLGTILGASFLVIRRNPKPTFGFSLLLTGATMLVSLVIGGVVVFTTVTRQMAASSQADRDAIEAGGAAALVLSLLIPLILSVMASALLQGIIVLEVARGTVGEKLRMGGLWRRVKGRAWALIGWVMLITAATVVAILLLAGIVALLSLAGPAGAAVGVGLMILLGLAALVGGVWLGVKLSMVPSAIVLERLTVRQAIRRSWSLTNGYFWRTFGIQLLVSVIYSTVSQLVVTPISLFAGVIGALLGAGDEEAVIVIFIIVYLVTILISIVVGAIGVVVQSATVALLYLDLRMRKEGLDVELIRFVDARAAGDADAPDPYLLTA